MLKLKRLKQHNDDYFNLLSLWKAFEMFEVCENFRLKQKEKILLVIAIIQRPWNTSWLKDYVVISRSVSFQNERVIYDQS